MPVCGPARRAAGGLALAAAALGLATARPAGAQQRAGVRARAVVMPVVAPEPAVVTALVRRLAETPGGQAQPSFRVAHGLWEARFRAEGDALPGQLRRHTLVISFSRN